MKVLEILADGAISTSALFLAISASNYNASYGRLNKAAEEIEDELRKTLGADGLFKQKRVFYSTISRLKRDGLIEQKYNRWWRTSRGINKASKNKERLPRGYIQEQSDTLKIIAFDIPEKHRRKRDWLRGRLSELGFQKLQKSIWLGQAGIPEEFISDLSELKILEFIDILEVTKKGTLNPIEN